MLLLLSGVAAAKGGYTVREVTHEVWHEPGGKRRPNQVKESYTLEAGGVLKYTAYFGGMPTEMNHMDSVEWKSGAQGKALLQLAARLANDATSGLKLVPDSEPTPEGNQVYVVGVTRDDADATCAVGDRKQKAWRELDAAFSRLVAEFEKKTGRPRTPGQLPQH